MSSSNVMIRADIRKILASVTVCVLIFILASASFIVVSEADHECTGDNCPVCVLIQHCENTMKGLGTAVAASVVLFILKTASTLFTSCMADCVVCRTPVSLKIRINS